MTRTDYFESTESPELTLNFKNVKIKLIPVWNKTKKSPSPINLFA